MVSPDTSSPTFVSTSKKITTPSLVKRAARATRLSFDEQRAIALLVDANATAEYRAGMTEPQAREAFDEQAGTFEMEDIDLEDL
jgi:hypothetical protein